MTGPSTISTADLRHLLQVVDQERCGEPGDELPNSLLSDLADLVPCDEITFFRMNPRQHSLATQTLGRLPADPPDVVELAWAAFSAGEVRSDRNGVGQQASHDPAHGPLSRRYHEAFLDFVGAREYTELTAYLPFEGSDWCDVSWIRLSGTPFSEREVLLASLLRPHLISLHHLHRQCRSAVPGLTPRQHEVLRLVAAGQSNTQIARSLFVSEATVRKHLENVYERLQVSSRTAAVAKLSLLPPTG
jgi:DNA-binding CsgD family transcriptional regulator